MTLPSVIMVKFTHFEFCHVVQRKGKIKMDMASYNVVKSEYGQDFTCNDCSYNVGIEQGSAYTQGPCGQQNCWLALAVWEREEREAM